MAILTGINTKLRGSAGNWTFSRLNGQTVAKEKVEKKATPVRTLPQMLRRVRWANLVNLYRSFNGTLHPSFEGKDPKLSDYNMFMQANLNSSNVALTKTIADQSGCVVDAYQITRGQLPSIVVEYGNANIPETDLAVGTLTLGNSTTLAAFSSAIIDNNEGWRNGDQLSAFIIRQYLNSTTQVPYVSIDAVEVTLDTSATTTLLKDVMDISLFNVADGCLALSGPVNGGVAFVHSRKVNGKTIVSTQFIAVSNTYLANYNTNAAFDAAIESYGGINKEDFLTPNLDDDLYPNVTP